MGSERLEGKRILILGFGREGRASLRFLKSRLSRASFAIADRQPLEALDEASKKELLSDASLELRFGESYLEGLLNYDVIVKSPGISRRIALIEAASRGGVEITSGTNIFFECSRAKTIGVTGTKGKSTTASLIHAMLSEAGVKSRLVGNIGKPALDALDDDERETLYVLELSSYQLEDFSGFLDIGVFLSLFSDHLDYHGGVESYYAAKLRLMGGIKPDGALVYNHAVNEIRDAAQSLAVALLPFNDELSRVRDGSFIIDGRALFPVGISKLLGKANQSNVLAALRTVSFLGIGPDAAKRALAGFSGLEHRLELLGTFGGIEFVNDAIANTPQSAISALETFEGRVDTIILGGFDRGYDFSDLARAVLDAGLRNVILLPQSGKRIWQAISERKGVSELPRAVFASDMESSVRSAYELTARGRICLLAPASPSYGLFRNFEEKGSEFKRLVKELSPRFA